ncbi:MAG: alpha/beta hydrolase [Lachnospiraceae bacterium]
MKAILYVHGKGGSYLEAEQYKKNCDGFDIFGVDYNDYLPWVVQNQIKAEYDNLIEKYDDVYLIAASIGAYFSMLTLQGRCIKKALFISPVLDMERLILDMLSWANANEKELCERREIQTDFGETLSWNYLKFVRANPIAWDIPTEILYGEKDNLTSHNTVNAFAKSHHANVAIMKNGEHWFHTDEQIAFLDKWMKEAIKM